MSKRRNEYLINEEGRECSKCGEFKTWDNFALDKQKKTGYRPICKGCDRDSWSNREVTPKAVLSHIYSNQVYICKRGGRPHPTYTREWLYDWAMENNFMEFFNTWISKGKDINYTPSVDRIDSNISYTEDNIQLMTWEDNDKKGKKECSKVVFLYNHYGLPLRKFNKVTEAKKEFSTALSPKRHFYKSSNYIVIYEEDFSMKLLYDLRVKLEELRRNK